AFAGLVAIMIALSMAAGAAALAGHAVHLSPTGNLVGSSHLADWLATKVLSVHSTVSATPSNASAC
ncbi:MAG TPA: hypothetical protein VIX15_04600, partial [Streptosporangiaceae bacterium]